jgi:hypothetical protein
MNQSQPILYLPQPCELAVPLAGCEALLTLMGF